MALIALKCSGCGGEIKIDGTKEMGYCMYCGNKFLVKDELIRIAIEHSGSIFIDKKKDIENLLIRAEQFEAEGNYERTLEYYDKVLDADAINTQALVGINRLKQKAYLGGIEVKPEVIEDIKNLLRHGEKIKAIKLTREATGLGLAEAKKTIDLFIVENRIDMSGYYKTSNKTSNKTSGACYIATSVYASYDCPEVWTLRRFRDYSLGTSRNGRIFIKFYYIVSPVIVEYFGNTKVFLGFWKRILDIFVNELQKRGYDSTPYEDKGLY